MGCLSKPLLTEEERKLFPLNASFYFLDSLVYKSKNFDFLQLVSLHADCAAALVVYHPFR